MKTFDEIIDILVSVKPTITEKDREDNLKIVKKLINKYADFQKEITSSQKFNMYSHVLASIALEHCIQDNLPAYFHSFKESLIMFLIIGLEINSLSDFEEDSKKDSVN